MGKNEPFGRNKGKYTKKQFFTHFEAKIIKNLILKNNFQSSEGYEYVSNISGMIKWIILYGMLTYLEAHISLQSD